MEESASPIPTIAAPTSGTNSTLVLPAVTLASAGAYSVDVFNAFGSVSSAKAMLTILVPALISQQPQSLSVRPGSNIVFSVAASSRTPFTFQWRFNGATIPGATSTSLLVTNVALEDEGDYDCVVTDGVGSVTTIPAHLAPWLSPVIVQKPVDLTVAAGSDFSLSVEATGNPLPFAYSWRRNFGSIVVNTNFGPYKTNFITLNTETALLGLTNNIQASNFVMRIVVYNDANRAPGSSVQFNITVLEDTDRDGIPNVVEAALGLDTNSVADATGDLDNDGMNNRAEYIAGTDPADSQSYLKIEQSITPGLATVQFAGISNRTYSVQFTDHLNASAWSNLADLTARSTNFTQQLADPSWTTNRFYRVVTPRQ